MGIFDEFYQKAKSLFGESKEPYKKKDYYELLEVSVKAEEDEIKKSYRRLALKWHPDKNPGKEEECAAYFTLLQQAYEVLMDPRERAFYDKHKDNILRDQDAATETRDDGMKLFEYFQPCFKGFGDDPQGFYSVYRNVFDKLATEEFPYLDDDDERNFPTFGTSTSDYDTCVALFYDFWTNFSTQRSFAWLDKWNLRDAPNRATVRAMEKENRKLREAGKSERNDEIRSLAIYIRKRDKRVIAFRAVLLERAEQKKQLVEERRRLQIRENLEKIGDHVEDEISKKEHLQDLTEIENALDNEFGIVKEGNDSDDEGKEEAQYCVVCEKSFKNSKSYANHQKSRKHKQALDELKKVMKDEDATLLQDSDNDESEKEEEGAPKRKGKGKKKRRKGPVIVDEVPAVSVEDTEIITEGVAEISVQEVEDNNTKELDEDIKEEEQHKEKAKIGKAKAKKLAKAAKKTEIKQPSASTDPVASECQICGLEFDSRSKLFKHIDATGHAALKTDTGNPNQKKKKNGKK